MILKALFMCRETNKNTLLWQKLQQGAERSICLPFLSSGLYRRPRNHTGSALKSGRGLSAIADHRRWGIAPRPETNFLVLLYTLCLKTQPLNCNFLQQQVLCFFAQYPLLAKKQLPFTQNGRIILSSLFTLGHLQNFPGICPRGRGARAGYSVAYRAKSSVATCRIRRYSSYSFHFLPELKYLFNLK
jgi:hypothetical protein